MESYLNIHEKTLTRFRDDIAYFLDHKEELTEKYPNKWVGIYHHKVVGVNKDLEPLIKGLKGKGIPTGKAVVEYLSTKETIMIL